MSWLDELFGTIYDNGVELELLGGLNFIGLTITPDPENSRYNLNVPGIGDLAASDIENDSSSSGETVADALSGLRSDLSLVSAAGSAGAIQACDGSGGFEDSGFSYSSAQMLGPQGAGYYALNQLGTPGTVNIPLVRLISGDIVVVGGGTESSKGLQLETDDGNVTVVLGTVTKVTVSPTAVTLASLALAGVTTLNGARVMAPTQGTNLTGGNQTVHVSGGCNYYMPPGSTSGAATITLGLTGALADVGMSFHIGIQSHNVVFVDDAATTLFTVSAGAAVNIDFGYDSTTSHYRRLLWKYAQ